MRYTSKQLAVVLVDATEQKGADVNEVTKGFVRFLSERNELKRIGDVLRSLDIVWKERHGAAAITIETPHPITETVRKQLMKIAEGADVQEVVRPELIGGARLRIDDRMIDGTVSGALTQLKRTLYGN